MKLVPDAALNVSWYCLHVLKKYLEKKEKYANQRGIELCASVNGSAHGRLNNFDRSLRVVFNTQAIATTILL